MKRRGVTQEATRRRAVFRLDDFPCSRLRSRPNRIEDDSGFLCSSREAEQHPRTKRTLREIDRRMLQKVSRTADFLNDTQGDRQECVQTPAQRLGVGFIVAGELDESSGRSHVTQGDVRSPICEGLHTQFGVAALVIGACLERNVQEPPTAIVGPQAIAHSVESEGLENFSANRFDHLVRVVCHLRLV